MFTTVLLASCVVVGALGQGIPMVFGPDDINHMLAGHNYWRDRMEGEISSNPTLPFLYWDEDLANMAQIFANECTGAHTDGSRRINEGENIASASTSLTYTLPELIDLAIQGWGQDEYELVVDPTLDEWTRMGTIGHFTQMVWKHTDAVGCGSAQCPSYDWTDPNTGTTWTFQYYLTYCVYWPKGNVNTNNETLYKILTESWPLIPV